MYRKDTDGWLKHWDFILLDMICLQLAFVLAYGLSGYGFNPYQTMIYRNMSIYIEVADLAVLFLLGTLRNVLKRGYYREFLITAYQSIVMGAVSVLYLFLIQQGQMYSRLAMILTFVLYTLLAYITRILWKRFLQSRRKEVGNHSLLIVTTCFFIFATSCLCLIYIILVNRHIIQYRYFISDEYSRAKSIKHFNIGKKLSFLW